MATPTLKPLDLNEPLGTPAAEWAQQTVEAIDPAASTGLVTDAHGNPTTDHGASALGGAPGHGLNADKTAGHMEAIAAHAPKATDLLPITTGNGAANGAAHTPGAGVFTDVHGNPTVNPNASALEGAPAFPAVPGHMGDSTATTPVQLPGGWIRSAGKPPLPLALYPKFSLTMHQALVNIPWPHPRPRSTKTSLPHSVQLAKQHFQPSQRASLGT
jgi:hypothetical protein